MPTLSDIAREGHKYGFVYTPLRGKIPLLQGWQKQPTPTLELILEWAAAGNLGVRTGAVSGVCVIDVESDASWPDESRLPATWSVNTGSGGRHYYFKHHPSVKNSVGKIADKVDTRGDGGQVVSTGSIHPVTGAVYEWRQAPGSVPLADFPEWLLTIFAEPVGAPAVSIAGRGYADAALRGECRAVAAASNGSRNDTLNRAAFKLGTLVGAGELQESDVVNALLEASPLPEQEARSTIMSGIRAGKQKPRAMPATRISPPRRPSGIVAAVRKTIESDPHRKSFATWNDLGLTLNSNGAPFANLDSACRVIEKNPGLAGHVWYDEFHGKIFTDANPSGGAAPATDAPREWTNADDAELTRFIQSAIQLQKISQETVSAAVGLVARRAPRNEVASWLQSLTWDGIARLPFLMSEGFGATADGPDYLAHVGRCWMVSMAARAIRPGCKVDTMPVFEGSQGTFKSQALAIIGGRWFSECHESMTSKDFYMVLQGNILVEISELHSFSRADIERIKGIISCPVDRYRAPYERRTESHPRRGVFAGTTNRNDWNRDETGARRFWPVACGYIDLDWISAARAQLFAEAAHMLATGGKWWDVPEDQAQAEQHERRQSDTWQDRIQAYLKDQNRLDVTIFDVMTNALNIPVALQHRHDQLRVASVMRALGYEKQRTFTSGVRGYFWRNNEQASGIYPTE